MALLQPVDVGGVTVSRATLHNEDELRRKDVRPGDRVRIIRAGDVIPEIKERVHQPGKQHGPPFSMPQHCPVCGARIIREGAYYLCPAGLSCAAQIAGRVVHYGSRNAMNIDHLGEKTVKQLVARDRIHDLADLYRLSVTDLKSLESFAEKSASELFEAIQSAKEALLDRFLFALGIRHVGSRMARVLANEFGSLPTLRQAGPEALQAVPEIGKEIARSVTDFFTEEENRRVLHRLAEAGVEVKDMPGRPAGRTLKGKTFVLTGTLEHFTRAAAKERIELLGGRATSSLSGETDYLVVGQNPGSKLEEAEKHRTKRIDEAEFRQLIEAK